MGWPLIHPDHLPEGVLAQFPAPLKRRGFAPVRGAGDCAAGRNVTGTSPAAQRGSLCRVRATGRWELIAPPLLEDVGQGTGVPHPGRAPDRGLKPGHVPFVHQA
ncbi:hypothetical protein Sm713_03060 [Streptomyces sp. TS71-3]|nr:hypothetical protein Sm713_03060 [Streptomyces sp. TS71-3]